jgi:hypothetical protein
MLAEVCFRSPCSTCGNPGRVGSLRAYFPLRREIGYHAGRAEGNSDANRTARPAFESQEATGFTCGATMKLCRLVSTPPGVITLTRPVVAPFGTVAVRKGILSLWRRRRPSR